MISEWLTAIVSALGYSLGTAGTIAVGATGAALGGAALGALGSGIQSAVSGDPFNWKGVGIGAGAGLASAGLGSALSAASPAASGAGAAGQAAEQAGTSALENVGTTAGTAGAGGAGTFLESGVKLGQEALGALNHFSQSFGPDAFRTALSDYGIAGEIAGQTGSGALRGAVLGAAANPRDPLRGGLSGAASGLVGGAVGGGASELPVRSAISTLDVPSVPGASMTPSVQTPWLAPTGAYDPTGIPSQLPFTSPSPTPLQSGYLQGAGLVGRAGSQAAGYATNMATAPEPPMPPYVSPLGNPNSPFPDFQNYYRYTRGGFGY